MVSGGQAPFILQGALEGALVGALEGVCRQGVRRDPRRLIYGQAGLQDGRSCIVRIAECNLANGITELSFILFFFPLNSFRVMTRFQEYVKNFIV